MLMRVSSFPVLGSTVLGPIKPDVFFTGEMNHHDVLAALAQNTTVILCKLSNLYFFHWALCFLFRYSRFFLPLRAGEHTNTERGYLSAGLKPRLEMIFEEMREKTGGEKIEVLVSKRDQNPLIIV